MDLARQQPCPGQINPQGFHTDQLLIFRSLEVKPLNVNATGKEIDSQFFNGKMAGNFVIHKG